MIRVPRRLEIIQAVVTVEDLKSLANILVNVRFNHKTQCMLVILYSNCLKRRVTVRGTVFWVFAPLLQWTLTTVTSI